MCLLFFFNDTATTEIYTLSLHDALPISAVLATQRTTYYAGGPLAIKLDPHAVPDLPEPRPAREVFVSSPRVMGVHLRFGAVARGGLRWSDRREDLRTEVLGRSEERRVGKECRSRWA